MKTLNALLVAATFFAVQVSAQDQGPGSSSGQPPVRWIDYLSALEKADIAREIVLREIKRLDAAGELYQDRESREVSFPVSFIPLDSAPTQEKGAAKGGGGNVSCSINTESPHAGAGPGGTRVVKAKSSGSCEYIHGFGEMPPTLGWDLQMNLVDMNFDPYSGQGPAITIANHVRNGLTVQWGASTAQVFLTTCVNGTYFHGDVVWIVPPAGWTYLGEQPLLIPNGQGALVIGC